ncbi:MAG: class I SAM-dependent methyltransferase [Bryobacteraceae bacterium]
MAPPAPAPDATSIIDLIEAFRRSKAMFTAVSMGLFDRLQLGAKSASALAEETGVSEDGLARLLDACAGLGLIHKHDGCYSNAPVAETFLCRSAPRSLAGYVLYSDRMLYPLWAHLEDAVREGTHRWAQTFGVKGPIFDNFFRTEESLRTFVQGMHGFGVLSSPRVVATFDLSRFRKLVDLGGATGHLAIAACERYPAMRAVVFDLAPVVELAREVVGKSSVADRVDLIAGDFFSGDLPEADLYAVGQILHDWSEAKIVALLDKIFRRLRRGGGLLIAERLLDPDKAGPTSTHMQSLNMLVCTEGRERTIEEYTELLRAAGFATVEGKRTGAPRDAVLAIK